MQPATDVISPIKPPELSSRRSPGGEPPFTGEPPRIILHGIRWETYTRLRCGGMLIGACEFSAWPMDNTWKWKTVSPFPF